MAAADGGGEARGDAIETTIDDLVARASALATAGGRRLLGIAGAPGSGKSTLAARIVAALGPELAVLVPMDGFHLAQRQLRLLGRQDRKGAFDTFDDAGYAELLRRVRGQDPASGERIYAPEFRRELEEPIAGAIAVDAGIPLVVTEGNYLLLDRGSWPDARACLDEAWFLTFDDARRRSRLIRRHQKFGRTADEARAWVLGTDEANARLISSTSARATLTIRLR